MNKLHEALINFFSREEKIKSAYVHGSHGKIYYADDASDLDIFIDGNINYKLFSRYLEDIFSLKIDLVTPENICEKRHVLWSLKHNHFCLKGQSDIVENIKITQEEFIYETLMRVKKVPYSIRKNNAPITLPPEKNHPFLGYFVPYGGESYSLRYVDKVIKYYAFKKLCDREIRIRSYNPKEWFQEFLITCNDDSSIDDLKFWQKLIESNGRVIYPKETSLFFEIIKRLKKLNKLELYLIS